MKNAAHALAVIDGGKFDDVARLLLEAGLSGRPLYLEGGDPAARAAAGHLVPLYEARDLRAAIALGREPGALVIWSWPKGEMALYRHLRTLNLVKIPNGARAEAEAAGEDVSGMPACETVLFRHWDPNVLGTLLPLLEARQQARFLGAAGGLALDAPDIGRMVAAPRPSGLPPPTPGMLRFGEGQLEQLGSAQAHASNGRIEAYLREVAEEETDGLSSEQVRRVISAAEESGKRYGLLDESAIGKWAFLLLITGGALAHDPTIARAFEESPYEPEVTLDGILEAMRIAAEREEGTA
jgi:hypothetical protein